jgi:hypothetical protein
MAFAQFEMKLVISSILSGFDRISLRTPDGCGIGTGVAT